MIGDRLFGYKERYYEKCKVCSSATEVIHLPLYVYGSEGVELCRDCRMILTELVKGMIRTAFNSRKWQRLIKDQKDKEN